MGDDLREGIAGIGFMGVTHFKAYQQVEGAHVAALARKASLVVVHGGGKEIDAALATAGTKGANGAKSTEEVAVNQVAWWVYGGYTQPDKKTMTYDEKAKPYTTKSGIKGSIAWGKSTDTPQRGKCASDGKAITFGFKNSEGDFVSWSLYGARGVKEEIPDSTIMKILATVRLHGKPTG